MTLDPSAQLSLAMPSTYRQIAALMILFTAPALAQWSVPLNPKPEDCRLLALRYSESLSRLLEDRTTCEKQDKGTVSTNGPYNPNCHSRQQAYISCAAVDDAICKVRTNMQQSSTACNSAAAERSAREDKRDQAAYASEIDRYKTAKRAYNEFQNAIKAEANPKKELQSGIKGAVQKASRSAAQNYGTEAPSSIPLLNAVNTASEHTRSLVPFNPVAKEIGDNSTAATKARLADSLSDLDIITTKAADGDITGKITKPASATERERGENARRQGFYFD